MPKKQNNTALVWFRNNLRIQDNQPLAEAIKNHDRVIAAYYFDPRHFELDLFGFKKTEKFRAQFLWQTVTELKTNLSKLNISLIVARQKPEEGIPELIDRYNLTAVYSQKEWTKEESQVTKLVKKRISPNIQWKEYFDQFLFHPHDIPYNFQEIPQVFSVFRKRLEKYVDVRAIQKSEALEKSNLLVEENSIPSLSNLGFENFETHHKTAFPFKGGENEALTRLDDYFFGTKKLGVYKKTRNGLVGVDYSSKFSPWLANGSISAKTIYWKVREFERDYFKNQSTYWLIFELIWRDYFKYISLKYGNDIFKIGGILQRDYKWSKDRTAVEQWINGETRDEFVNANMIELKKTGWMSNRGRQNVASYFAKELQLDWRIGAAYFESVLLDYDVHSNYGNWMYVAGVGNDPRDRKFNTQLQAERYDGDGRFRKMWLQQSLF